MGLQRFQMHGLLKQRFKQEEKNGNFFTFCCFFFSSLKGFLTSGLNTEDTCSVLMGDSRFLYVNWGFWVAYIFISFFMYFFSFLFFLMKIAILRSLYFPDPGLIILCFIYFYENYRLLIPGV